MKKLLAVFMAVMALSVNAFAATEVNVVVDKTPVEQKGVIVDNRTLVPVRGVFEKMGYTAEYDAETKTATLKKGSDVLKFTAGENYFTYNDKKIETEEENIYAMLFGLKECPYHMYTFFIMKNDDDKPMINSSLK